MIFKEDFYWSLLRLKLETELLPHRAQDSKESAFAQPERDIRLSRAIGVTRFHKSRSELCVFCSPT